MTGRSQNPKSKKSTFPHKLWQMVNDCRFESAIRWTDGGTSFEITEGELKKLCLGKGNKLFYTEQPKSFIRQLHMYGFKKINRNQFQHCFFQRSRPQLIENIKRSYKSAPAKSDDVANDQLQLEQQHELSSSTDISSMAEQSTSAPPCDKDVNPPSKEKSHDFHPSLDSSMQPINLEDRDPLTMNGDEYQNWQPVYDYPYGCREESYYDYRDDSVYYYNDSKPLEYMY